MEWVEAPNTLGMALCADGARLITKPYVADGACIHRMSNDCNDCSGCRYKLTVRVGESAYPMTVMYWDFVARHATRLEGNPRTVMMVKNLGRLDKAEVEAIRATVQRMRDQSDAL